MEKKTLGKFISALRKANGMTQKELGEKLFVSDKTVSRWECDECTPELSLIPSIAEIFGITADELLRGERNNPEREPEDEDKAGKQKAKSEKQFKLMLHCRKKRFTNLSVISAGLCLVGLIAAMICNLGFSEGLLGFCIACIFLVAAAVCQICFALSFRLLIDAEEAKYAEEIKKANTGMVFCSVKVFFGILLTFAFCLPIAALTHSDSGVSYGLLFDSWILFGALFSAAAFIIAFCIYKLFVLKLLINKEIVWPDAQSIDKFNTDSRLLAKICTVFVIVLIAVLLATYIITSCVSESDFIERQRFDNPDNFIEYMQSEYDAWFEEGYGNLPPSEIPSPEPNKKWAEIDGKEYYYNPILYESIRILQHEDGEWEIVVTTDEADQNGQAMYSVLNAGLLSLHVINLAVCAAWYLLKTKKIKTA